MIEIYAKKQRAKRKDPQQEAIVTEKDKLNERTTKLIALMKAMKSGWNGGPSPDIGVEKFNLTQPMPDVVVGSGDAALNELSGIIQTLHQIKSMQDSYSNARIQRMEQMKKMQEQSVPAPVQNTQQPATASIINSLVKEASNPISRIWAHIVAYNPFSSEKNRGDRLSLLRALGRLDDNLQEVEDKILSTGESSILDSIYIAKQLYSDAKSSFFGTFRKNITKVLDDTNKELEELKRQISSAREGEKNQLVQNNNKAVLNVIEQVKEVINEPVVKEEDIKKEDKPLATDPIKFPSEENLTKNLEGEQKQVDPEQKNEPEPKKIDKRKNPITRRKRRIPIAPIVETQKSDFVDSDFEKNQEEEKYKAVVKYLYNNIDSLIKESFSISNGNLLQPWKNLAIQEYRKAYQFATKILTDIKNGNDYEYDYVAFLHSIGIIKSIEYIYSVEQNAIKDDDSLQPGFMYDESEIKSHGDNFAKSEFEKYHEMISSKIANASTDVSRFIKRMITHIIPRKDRSLRLTISRNIRQVRIGLQKMLSLLEQKNLDFRALISVSEVFFESLKNCYEGLADLADMYNSTMRIEKSYKKQNKERMMYDLIPTIDISAMRTIQRHIETDSLNVQKLQEIELSMVETSEILEKRMPNGL